MQAISERALVARINRHLKGAEVVKTCRRESRWFQELGRFYSHNERNFVTQTDIHLEELGRELGVLREGESVAEAQA